MNKKEAETKAKAELAAKRAAASIERERDANARDLPPGIEETARPQGVYAKLAAVQSRLAVPKARHNRFGGYNYRSAEDILNAVKPLLRDVGAIITVSDALRENARGVYIEASARFVDIETGDVELVTAYAREPVTKKGMDDSQITGAASSYARKYALNGLLLIDDTQDADAQPPPAEGLNF